MVILVHRKWRLIPAAVASLLTVALGMGSLSVAVYSPTPLAGGPTFRDVSVKVYPSEVFGTICVKPKIDPAHTDPKLDYCYGQYSPISYIHSQDDKFRRYMGEPDWYDDNRIISHCLCMPPPVSFFPTGDFNGDAAAQKYIDSLRPQLWKWASKVKS